MGHDIPAAFLIGDSADRRYGESNTLLAEVIRVRGDGGGRGPPGRQFYRPKELMVSTGDSHSVLRQVSTSQRAPAGDEIGGLRAETMASRCGAEFPCVIEDWASDVGEQRQPCCSAGFHPRGIELTWGLDLGSWCTRRASVAHASSFKLH